MTNGLAIAKPIQRPVLRPWEAATLIKGGGVSPITILGSDLLAWWTADRSDLISLSGAAVTAWVDAVQGYAATQGISAARPLYSTSSFNGHPGITSDGVDDELTCADSALLTAIADGSEPGEMWSIADQTSLVADTTVRILFSYGNGLSVARRMTRVVTVGANRVAANIGTGSGNVAILNGSGVDFYGRHYVRLAVGSAESQIDIDAVAGAPTAAVPATTASRVRLFASDAGTAGSFFKGVGRDFLITRPLTAAKRAKLEEWAASRIA